jgi:hypothetical protein
MRPYSIRVLAGPLRVVSVLATAIVVLSFVLFAIDETRAASKRSAAETAGLEASRSSDPSPDAERAREAAHSSVREAIDDADDVLLTPFSWAEPDTTNTWVRRGIPAVLAVLVYGLVLSFLARYAKGVA